MLTQSSVPRITNNSPWQTNLAETYIKFNSVEIYFVKIYVDKDVGFLSYSIYDQTYTTLLVLSVGKEIVDQLDQTLCSQETC